MGEITTITSKSKRGIQNSLRQLEEEERECENMRAKYRSDWTQVPSAGLTGSLRQELKGHAETLSQAQGNDDLLEAQWLKYRGDIEILASGEDGLALREAFKQVGSSKPVSSGEASLLDLADEEEPIGSGKVSELVRTVEKGIGGLNVIKRERQTTLKQLKEAVCPPSIYLTI